MTSDDLPATPDHQLYQDHHMILVIISGHDPERVFFGYSREAGSIFIFPRRLITGHEIDWTLGHQDTNSEAHVLWVLPTDDLL